MSTKAAHKWIMFRVLQQPMCLVLLTMNIQVTNSGHFRTVGQERLSTSSRHRLFKVTSLRKSPILGPKIQQQFFFPMKNFLGPLHFILYILAWQKIRLFLFSLLQPTHSKTSEQATKNDRKKNA